VGQQEAGHAKTGSSDEAVTAGTGAFPIATTSLSVQAWAPSSGSAVFPTPKLTAGRKPFPSSDRHCRLSFGDGCAKGFGCLRFGFMLAARSRRGRSKSIHKGILSSWVRPQLEAAGAQVGSLPCGSAQRKPA